MPPKRPPFAARRRWFWRASHARRNDYRVYYDPDSGFEYMRDPNLNKRTWHEIDARKGVYRDIDPDSGEPVAGSEGRWRPLR